MVRLFNINVFYFMEYLKNNQLYQIDYKNLYVKRINNNLYFYSYNTCILQIDFDTKTIYKNINSYSITTSKQRNYILRNINLDYFNIVDITPVHQRNGYYIILKLDYLKAV